MDHLHKSNQKEEREIDPRKDSIPPSLLELLYQYKDKSL